MIHIACNIDSNYVRHCAVTLVSLFENNRLEEFAVHIIARGLSDGEREILTELAAKYGNRVLFYEPDFSLLEGFTIRKFSKRISMATYYRCILSALLPRDIDKVLYLDCDIVVMGDIRPFWNTPLDGVGVAAVEDMGCHEAARYEILKYPMTDSYFNAGVLLVNLAYWREHDVPRACIDYFHRYPDRILFNDQDLLNSVLHGHKRLVDLKWNVQDAFYRQALQHDEVWHGRLDETLRHPVIIHFTNRKPWEYDSQHPLRDVYFKYQDLTPWAGQRVLHNPLAQAKRFFRLLPFYVGLRRPKYVQWEDPQLFMRKRPKGVKRLLKQIEGFFSFIKQKYIVWYLLHWVGEKVVVERYREQTNETGGTIGREAPVWVCWWQGEEAMPDIAKACVQSIRSHAGNHPVRFLSEKNYREYVDLPASIEEKRRKGFIDLTHFSDILRTVLLARYGGIWLDCTVLIPARDLDTFVRPTARFWSCHHRPLYHNISRGGWTSFFWACGKGNVLAAFMADFHLHYWERQDRLVVYLLLDYAFALGRRFVPAIRQMADEVPLTAMGPLGKCLNDAYTEEAWERFCTDYDFHKLTYKVPLHRTTPDGRKTFYGHIMETYGLHLH